MSPKRKREWFDDDDLWRDLYLFMFPKSRMDGTAAEVEDLLRLVHPRGKDVLDLCCGPGRFAVELAKRKYRVTGVDRTSFLLAKARARARAARVPVEWVRQDMRDFVRPGAYDLAINMETSFGYFDDKDEDLLVLRQMAESLKPGGTCVLQLGGKEWLARVFAPVTAHSLPDGSQLVQEHAIFDDWTRIRNRWTLIRGRKAKSFTFHHTLYSGQELRDRMERSGFTDVRLHGDLDGSEYGRSSKWLVAVGRRG